MAKLKEVLLKIYREHKWIYVFVLFASFMYSMNFKNGSIQILDDFFEFARVGSFIIITIWFILAKKKPSKLVIILLIMQLWQLFVTCITNRKIVVSIYDLSASLAIALLIELFLDEPKELLKGMLLHYELAIYPNLITMLININTDSDSFYLGDHNVVNQFFIPAIAVAFIYMYLTNNKKRCIPLILVSLLSCILCRSTTTLFGIIISIVIFCFGYFLKKDKNVSTLIIFLFAVAINVFLMFFYSEETFPEIRLFLIRYFGKSMPFSGREEIWPIALQMIKEQPLIGYGYRTTVKVNNSFTAGHAHNMFLDKALVGGIPELLMFLWLQVELFIKVERQKPNICKLVLVSLMGFIFMTYIMDSYMKFWRFYVVIFLLYHLEEILKDKGVVKNEK